MSERANLPCPLQSCAATMRLFRDTERLLCAGSLLGGGAIERNDRDNQCSWHSGIYTFFIYIKKQVDNYIDKMFSGSKGCIKNKAGQRDKKMDGGPREGEKVTLEQRLNELRRHKGWENLVEGKQVQRPGGSLLDVFKPEGEGRRPHQRRDGQRPASASRSQQQPPESTMWDSGRL